MSVIAKEIFKNVRRIQIRTNRTVNDILAGAYHSVFKGQGIEFEDVREYQPGDDIRSIDWNVTARMNFPFVKNFREEREITVMILVDVSASTHFGTTGKQKNDIIAEISAVLAFSAIKNNDKVGLILFSDTIEKYLPPQKGIKHVLRAIRELIVFKPEGKKTDIGMALSFLGKVQKRSGICFIISDFINPDYSHECTIIAKRYDLISICLSDPREYDIPSMGLVTLRDLETGESVLIDTSLRETHQHLAQQNIQHLERNKILMNKIGAGFINISTDRSYVDAIHEYFTIREKQKKWRS